MLKRRRLERLKPFPARLMGGEVAGDPSPEDGSATVTRSPAWEGVATSQPLPTAEAVAQGRAVEREQRAFFLPLGLDVRTGQALEADRGEGWESWNIYKVEPWASFTYVLGERERSPNA